MGLVYSMRMCISCSLLVNILGNFAPPNRPLGALGGDTDDEHPDVMPIHGGRLLGNSQSSLYPFVSQTFGSCSPCWTHIPGWLFNWFLSPMTHDATLHNLSLVGPRLCASAVRHSLQEQGRSASLGCSLRLPAISFGPATHQGMALRN